MKITKEDFQRMKDQIALVLDQAEAREYRRKCITGYQTFERYSWQVWHARKNTKHMEKETVIEGYLLDNLLYSYCNDSNIQTALNQILDKNSYLKGQLRSPKPDKYKTL